MCVFYYYNKVTCKAVSTPAPESTKENILRVPSKDLPTGFEATPEIRCIIETCVQCFKHYINDASLLSSGRQLGNGTGSTEKRITSVCMTLAVAYTVSNAIEIVASICNFMRQGFQPLMIQVLTASD